MLIDTHCHIYDDKIENAQEIIDNMKTNGLEKIIVCGCDFVSCQKALKLALQNENVYCSLGVHPENANELSDEMLQYILNNADNPKVVAVGEIGLDYFNEFFPKELQKEIFVKQIKLASSLNLPIIVHIREAYGDALEILKQNAQHLSAGVVLHCFSGSAEFYSEIEKMGFYVSLGGVLTYKNNIKGISVAQKINREKFMLETDSPYLAPVPLRGTVNEPKNTIYVARKLSDIWGVSEEKIIEMATNNSYQFFKKMKRGN